jgi:DNA-binding NarL/FixJ family response regulator
VSGETGPGIRVLIADDEALVRTGFRMLVESAPDLCVVGEASDGIQAVRQARALRPDVVLMDIRMPIMHGLEATKVILDDGPPPRILVVTTFDQDEHVFEALRAGASGFVLKDTPPEKLLEAIRVVASGEALLTPSVTRRLIAEFTRRPRALPPAEGLLAELTEREHEVLQQVAAGLSNAETAANLHLSIATVKTHVSSLLSKLNARDRAQLVVIAYETGVATPGQNRPAGRLRQVRVHLGRDPDQALLHHRHHQLALRGEHLTAGQAPAAVGHR